MHDTSPRSFATQFRMAGLALAGLAVLLLMLSLALRGSPDPGMQAFAQGCRTVWPWLVGLALICGLLAYALRPADDIAPPTGDSTEFAPDATDFVRSAMPTDVRPQQRD